MSFKNLEQRYNENVEKLYSGATNKFEGGRATRGANDDPLVVRRPGDGYFGGASRALGRAFPASSSVEDVKRLTLFTLSGRGVAFLLKQQLLQTGNSFEQTRLINPAFVVGNAVPFLHLRRHLRPVTGGPGGALLGKTDMSYANIRKLGQLQKSTYDSFTESGTGGVLSLLKKIAGPITSTISAVTAKKNVGEEFGYGTPSEPEGWVKSRPELGKNSNGYVVPKMLINPPPQTGGVLGGIFNSIRAAITGTNAATARVGFRFGGKAYTDTFSSQKYGAMGEAWKGTYKTYLAKTDGETKWSHGFLGSTYNLTLTPPDLSANAEETNLLNSWRSTLESQLDEQIDTYFDEPTVFIPESTNTGTSLAEKLPLSTDIQTFLEYFRPEDIFSIKSRNDAVRGSINARDQATYARELAGDPTKRISYVKDASNKLIRGGSPGVLPAYRDINSTFDDPITVSFAMSADSPVRFRAFIKNLTQSASPEYKTYQYVGRIEKFISYVTVQREISFKLGVIAFSKDEIDGVWSRINYLTGLVYPYGWNRGIFQPNIIRLTIGNVYVDQPGYITALSTNFNELSESWDIDREVPISAEMDMKFVLIEKRTKTAASPFYGITEDNTAFSQDVAAAAPRSTDADPTTLLVERRAVSPVGLSPAKINSPLPGPSIPNVIPVPVPPRPAQLNPENFRNLIPGG